MTISFKTKYEPYQHLWMLVDGMITEVVPCELSYHGCKGGIKKEYWENDNTHITYKVGNVWVSENKLFPTKEDLLFDLAKNAKPLPQ